MHTLTQGVQGFAFLIELNRDRLLSVLVLGGAMWAGAYLATL
ncbi:hypothetical protein AAD018_006705 [Aestuariibius insulae]